MGIKRVGVVVSLAALIGLAGCGSSSGSDGSSATTTTTSVASTTSTAGSATSTSAAPERTTAVGSTTTAVPTTTSAPSTGGRDAFVGEWYDHGGHLTVPASGNVTVTFADGPKIEVLHLSAALSPDADRLHLTVLDFGFADPTTSSTVASDGFPQDEFTPGDTMDLQKVRTGELQFVDIKTMHKPLGGEPYWCGPGLDPAYRNDCGA